LVSARSSTIVSSSRGGFSLEAVREYVVLANQFSAEYGHSAGGQFNIITKAGGNAWHGAAFGYNQNRHYNSRAGLYNNKTEMLKLQQNIVVTSSAYEAYLSEALVNVRTNHIVSERPVEVKMLQGTINANRLEMLNSGEIIRFEHTPHPVEFEMYYSA